MCRVSHPLLPSAHRAVRVDFARQLLGHVRVSIAVQTLPEASQFPPDPPPFVKGNLLFARGAPRNKGLICLSLLHNEGAPSRHLFHITNPTDIDTHTHTHQSRAAGIPQGKAQRQTRVDCLAPAVTWLHGRDETNDAPPSALSLASTRERKNRRKPTDRHRLYTHYHGSVAVLHTSRLHRLLCRWHPYILPAQRTRASARNMYISSLGYVRSTDQTSGIEDWAALVQVRHGLQTPNQSKANKRHAF